MKKIIFCFFVFCVLFSAFSLHAQQYALPDGSFETSWIEEEGADHKPYLEYSTEFFYTLNSLRGLPNDPLLADLTAFRENLNAQSGQYCIKLQSGVVPVGEGIVFLPGMVGTLSQGFVNEFLNGGGEVSITRDWAYNTPHALEGYYKYKPVSGDSALIDIGFSEFDEEIFVKKIIIKETNEWEWKHFVIPIPEQYRNEYFNRIRMLFVASAGVDFNHLDECKGQKGSTLWIDNLSLNYDLGIKQNLFSTLKAKTYPNPANEVLNIELNENFTGTIAVYNINGSMVVEESINGTECQLNTSSLSTGNYFYRVMNGNTIFAQGKFVVTK